MNNKELKKKILTIVRGAMVEADELPFIETTDNIADALIAAEIGDVREWKERTEFFEQAFSDCGNDLAEMEHLAEVAEKALQYAVSEYRCDECPCLDCNTEIRGSQECIDLIIKTYKESAEVELKKEKDND